MIEDCFGQVSCTLIRERKPEHCSIGHHVESNANPVRVAVSRGGVSPRGEPVDIRYSSGHVVPARVGVVCEKYCTIVQTLSRTIVQYFSNSVKKPRVSEASGIA